MLIHIPTQPENTMNQQQIAAAAEIVKTGALEFLAAKHNLSVDQVVAAIAAGDTRARAQFHELAVAGINKVLQMVDDGEICR